MNDKNDAVGYGRPPQSTRFKKGQSGNPKGRPQGVRNFASDVREVLSATVSVNENGQTKRVSTQRATLMRLREKALKGDARAMDRLLALAETMGAEADATSAERVLKAAEEDILERFVQARVAINSENKGPKGGHGDESAS